MFSFEPRYLFEDQSSIYASPIPNFDESIAAEVVISKKFTDVIVLLEDEWGATLKTAYEEKGLRVLHFPIEDFGTPSPNQLEEWIPQIVKLMQTPNHKILIHCQGGIGRTGLISACVFAALNKKTGNEAIRKIRLTIPHAVETSEQERCVSRFANKIIKGLL
jgi:protein-tyrosine phosphatase